MYAFGSIRPYKGHSPLLSAEQQIEIMDAKGISKAVILPILHAESPAEHQSCGEVLHICKKYPGRFIPFCNVDPRAIDLPGMKGADKFLFWLEQYKQLGCKGLGELTCRLRWDHPGMLALMEACGEAGFPVTFHTSTEDKHTYGVIDEMGLPGLEMVLKRFPDLIIFGHSQAFWSEISSGLNAGEKSGYPKGPVKEGGAVVRLMREYPNLYGDLSAGSGLNALRRDPDFTWPFLEEFQDRLLFGLDNCLPENDMKHLEWLMQARQAGNISEEIFQKVTCHNISRVLNPDT
jgi:hypothetical protein